MAEPAPATREADARGADEDEDEDAEPRLPAQVPETAFFFGAVVLSDSVRRFARGVQDAMVREYALPERARVNVLDDLHITLVPSMYPRSRAAEVRGALVGAVADARCEPFDVRLVGVATFGDAVVWGVPAFQPSHAPHAMQRAFGRRWLGPPPAKERARWTPHATLLKTKRVPRDPGTGRKPRLLVDTDKYSRVFLEQPDEHVRCRVSAVQLLISCGTPQYVRVGPPVPLFGAQ